MVTMEKRWYFGKQYGTIPKTMELNIFTQVKKTIVDYLKL